MKNPPSRAVLRAAFLIPAFLAPAIFTLALLAPGAAEAQIRCLPRAFVESRLHAVEEGVKGRGITPGGQLVEVWQSADGSAFTITITAPHAKYPGGITCPIASGTDWEWVILYVPPQGQADG